MHSSSLRHLAVALLLAISATSAPVFAERPSDFEGKTILRPGGGGIVGGGDDSGFMSNAGAIKNDMNAIEGNGREFKFQEAERLAKEGKDAANSAGAKYLAAAMSELPSIILPVHLAGVRHLNKAMLEFKQAAADSRVESQNGASEDLLRAEAGQSGKQARPESGNAAMAENAVAALRENKGMQEYFVSKGINGEEFVDKLVKGQFADGDDMMRSLGQNPQLLRDAMAQPESAAVAKTVLESKGDPNEKVGMSDGAKADASIASAAGKSGPASAATASATGAPAPATAATAPTTGAAAPTTGAVTGPTTTANAAAIAKAAALGFDAAAFGGLQSSLSDAALSFRRQSARAGLVDPDVFGSTLGAAERAAHRAQLEKSGVLLPRNGANVFEISHSNYRAYDRWRKSEEGVVAAVSER